jgi:hypothetical protein
MMVATETALFIMGGENNVCGTKAAKRLGHIDEYHVTTKEWEVSIGELRTPVCRAAAALVGDTIFVFGGESNSHESTTIVQCFHTRQRSTSHVTDLSFPYSSIAVIPHDKILFLICNNGDLLEFNSETTTCTVRSRLNTYDVSEVSGAAHYRGDLFVFAPLMQELMRVDPTCERGHIEWCHIPSRMRSYCCLVRTVIARESLTHERMTRDQPGCSDTDVVFPSQPFSPQLSQYNRSRITYCLVR